MSKTLRVNEIFLSLQGESSFVGLPCVFVRLAGCNLRCSYCDTAYAFKEGQELTLEEIVQRIRKLAEPYPNRPAQPKLPLVELTGGEPLLQPNALPLLELLCDERYTVLLETNGALDIAGVDPRVRRIVDLKCPSSGEADRNRWANLAHLRSTDEVKFVIATVQDYEWTRATILKHRLADLCPLLCSWVHPLAPQQQDETLKPAPAGHTPLSRLQLAERIIADGLPVRLQVQLHKIVWPPERRGV